MSVNGKMDSITKAMAALTQGQQEQNHSTTVPFEDYLQTLRERPDAMVRNVFQVFHDMIKSHAGTGVDEYPDDPESIHFMAYNFDSLFRHGVDQPFFTDRIFANRLMNLVDAFRGGAQQNKIYIFDGPPGCGKSTFLNNLLRRFEEYSNSEAGMRYEVVWRLDRNLLGAIQEFQSRPVIEKLAKMLEAPNQEPDVGSELSVRVTDDYVEVPCPSHDHPILMIPKEQRPDFFDALFENDEFKWNLSTGKEYDWVFHDKPCTICSSLYRSLYSRLGDTGEVFKMIYTRPFQFNRRLGEGITVFNPGDRPGRQNVMTNPMIQKRINALLRDSNLVKYLFSRYAKTNNGIYALMDIKGHNKERVIELHNIISDGVHKVEDLEENVDSLFIAVMNPEDNKNLRGFQSFSDRIEFVNISYVLDAGTESEIYKNVFGRHIGQAFLPRILECFARVIISSRLNIKSPAMLEWISSPGKYKRYCDDNLQLLKMDIYSGVIPTWLDESDRKSFTAKRRRKIIAEADTEGDKGFSGRDSINIFGELYSAYSKESSLINMSTLVNFFTKVRKDLSESIPSGFLESLQRMYNYSILQEVKESLYYYNEEQIAHDIQNYLFALNYEIGTSEVCNFTGEKLDITEEFLESIENRLIGGDADRGQRLLFRQETQKEYTSRTLTQEILVENMSVVETELYGSLYNRYVFSLKEKVLEPFLENANFRRAIKDFSKEEFRTYDKRIRDDVTFLINNLCDNFGYNELGAREVCIYVVDNDLAKTFARESD